MKILVPVKACIDPDFKIKVQSLEQKIDLSHCKYVMNPYDEVALEQAIQLRENGVASEVITLSCGQKSSQEILKKSLAFGADKAIYVSTNHPLDPLSTTKYIQYVFNREKVNLVLMGNQSIDNENQQIPQMLAALSQSAQATHVTKLKYKNNQFEVTRELDWGSECLLLYLPAVIAVDLRLNEPRYITLPNIIKAKKKPFEMISSDTIGLVLKSRLSTLKIENPPSRSKTFLVNDINELAQKLNNAHLDIKKARR